MKELLVTRSNYDDATSYTFYYAGLVIDEAVDKGIKVIDLKRPRLKREIFTEIVESKSPVFIFFNAHGNERVIYGDKINDKEEILIEEGLNHQLLDGRLIYARSCWSAASLGKACKEGCFIGYNIPFKFWIDENWSSNPAKDKTARIFFEPSNLIASSLIKGNTAEESVNKSVLLSKKNMLKLMKDENEPGATVSIMLLWNNMTGLEILGNEKMKIE